MFAKLIKWNVCIKKDTFWKHLDDLNDHTTFSLNIFVSWELTKHILDPVQQNEEQMMHTLGVI